MIYETIVSRQFIDKGWSVDRKYCVTTEDGSRYLLRISPTELYERRKREFAQMQKAAGLGVDMCLPVEFGICPEGVYALHSWIDGSDAEEAIAKLSSRDQYVCGLTAGRMLAKLHSLPAPGDGHDWEGYFTAKVQRKIAAYRSCGLRYSHGDAMVQYLTENLALLHNRPVTFQHGDYHIGNMMLGRDGKLFIIDFEKADIGDPWEEFNRIVWSAQAAPDFARGIVDGYFPKGVPEGFWKLMAYYICSNSVGALPWAIPYGQQEVDTITAQGEEILRWYDNMNTTVPSWYRKE